MSEVNPGPYAGKYPFEHHPFVGPRPMLYPYTLLGKLAQFPFVYYWRYSWSFKYFFYAMIPTTMIMYKLEQFSYSPANVEKWKKIREEWYTPHKSPEDDLM